MAYTTKEELKFTFEDGTEKSVEIEVQHGEDGAKGAKGEKGEKGDTGAQGIQGIQGEKGEKGDTGAQGIQGVKGDKGDTGAKGDKGDTGAQGIQGVKGDKGDTGAQGPQGIRGEKGEKGDTGATGAKGAKGDAGASITGVTYNQQTNAFVFTTSDGGSYNTPAPELALTLTKLCELMNTAPAVTSATDYSMLIHTAEGCKLLQVQGGQYADVRAQIAFDRSVLQGGQNYLQATAMNLRAEDAGAVHMVITAPTNAGVTLGEPSISKPDGTTVTLVSSDAGVYTYLIDNLRGGARVTVSIPVTYANAGTFTASHRVVMQNKTITDYATNDDYATTSTVVGGVTAQIPSASCPLLQVKHGTKNLVIYEMNRTALITVHSTIGLPMKQSNQAGYICRVNDTITFNEGVVYGVSHTLINNDNASVINAVQIDGTWYRTGLLTNNQTHISNSVTADSPAVAMTPTSIQFRERGLYRIEFKVGENCKTQYVFVLVLDDALTVTDARDLSVAGVGIATGSVVNSYQAGGATLYFTDGKGVIYTSSVVDLPRNTQTGVISHVRNLTQAEVRLKAGESKMFLLELSSPSGTVTTANLINALTGNNYSSGRIRMFKDSDTRIRVEVDNTVTASDSFTVGKLKFTVT